MLKVILSFGGNEETLIVEAIAPEFTIGDFGAKDSDKLFGGVILGFPEEETRIMQRVYHAASEHGRLQIHALNNEIYVGAVVACEHVRDKDEVIQSLLSGLGPAGEGVSANKFKEIAFVSGADLTELEEARLRKHLADDGAVAIILLVEGTQTSVFGHAVNEIHETVPEATLKILS